MAYTPALVVHIGAGMIGVLAGSTALVVRKGGRLHRKAGDVFVGSMLIMAATGAYVALMASQRMNVLAATVTFYLVATAWLTVKRKAKETGRAEFALLFMALAAGVGGWGIGFQVAGTPRSFAAMYFVFGSVALLCAAGDVRLLVRGGVAGAQRLVRHLWRMGFALFIAAGSFFLGMAGDPAMRQSGLRARMFSPEVRSTGLPAIPVLIIVVLTIFWLFRVKFAKKYRQTADPLAHRAGVPARITRAG
jgi:hypothetical protein